MAILTSDNLKNYLGISGSDYDDKITLIVAGIDAFVESYTNRKFASASRDEYLDGGGEFLKATFVPIASIDSITDEDDGSSVVSSDDYEFRPETGMIYLDAPVTTAAFTDSEGRLKWGAGKRRYRVQYTGGESSVPADVTLAALQLAAGRFNRVDPGLSGEKDGDYSYSVDLGAFDKAGLPPGVKATLDQYRFDPPI